MSQVARSGKILVQFQLEQLNQNHFIQSFILLEDLQLLMYMLGASRGLSKLGPNYITKYNLFKKNKEWDLV